MPPRIRLSDADRERALASIQEGISLRNIGRRLQASLSVIQQLWDRWQATRTVREVRRPGQPTTTFRQHDRHVVPSCLRDCTVTARVLQGDLSATSNITGSNQTICNRLRDAGLQSRCAVVRPLLTPGHRVRRRHFATDHPTWTRNRWARVLFTYESRYTLQ